MRLLTRLAGHVALSAALTRLRAVAGEDHKAAAALDSVTALLAAGVTPAQFRRLVAVLGDRKLSGRCMATNQASQVRCEAEEGHRGLHFYHYPGTGRGDGKTLEWSDL